MAEKTLRGLQVCLIPLTLTIGVVLDASPVQARITRIVIQNTVSPAFGGASFGAVGPYEQLDGVAYGEADPRQARNAIIQDIALAPRNARGMVEYAMDVSILKPIDLRRGNGTILYDVVNRGGKVADTRLNIPTRGNGGAGDGFLQ